MLEKIATSFCLIVFGIMLGYVWCWHHLA